MTAEKAFETEIKRFLDSHKIWHVKYFANRNTKAGIPDILACVNGYFVGIEVKAQKGSPSALQMYNVRKIRESGGFAVVVYPSGFEKLKDFILDLKDEIFNRDMEMIFK